MCPIAMAASTLESWAGLGPLSSAVAITWEANSGLCGNPVSGASGDPVWPAWGMGRAEGKHLGSGKGGERVSLWVEVGSLAIS